MSKFITHLNLKMIVLSTFFVQQTYSFNPCIENGVKTTGVAAGAYVGGVTGLALFVGKVVELWWNAETYVPHEEVHIKRFLFKISRRPGIPMAIGAVAGGLVGYAAAHAGLAGVKQLIQLRDAKK